MKRASIREPEASYEEGGAPTDERVSVSIHDPDLCSRYTASVIEGVTVGESPLWLQGELLRLGYRSVNNVVDATNLAMYEHGQPVHAFDLDQISDTTVIVRRAREGERLRTLDNVDRTLGPENLVIADSQEPLALAGIIGGVTSAIGPGTTTILLESATFEPLNNRATARSMGLRTEATQRFEKGLRPELAPIALRHAAALIQKVAGGKVAPGTIDVFPDPSVSPLIVHLRSSRLHQVLGMDLEMDQVESALTSLGLSFEFTDDETFAVTVPYWRSDLNIEEDLIEEVIRIIGYDAVPTTMLATPIPHQTPEPMPALQETVKDLLVASGMQEVITYPLVSRQDLEQVEQMDRAAPPLRVVKPMSQRHEYLRTTLQAGLMRTLKSNQGNMDDLVQLFEVGRVFHQRPDELPEELEMVAGVMIGRRRRESWLERNGTVDFYDAKGVVEWTLNRLGVDADFKNGSHPTYSPGRCAAVVSSETLIGYVGEIHPTVHDRLGTGQSTTVGFELNMATLLDAMPDNFRRFSPLPRFPAATRDLSLDAPMDVPAGRIFKLILKHPLVERAELFEVYSGENVVDDRKSLNFHVHFRANDRTLTNEQVNRETDMIVGRLEREVRTSLRN